MSGAQDDCVQKEAERWKNSINWKDPGEEIIRDVGDQYNMTAVEMEQMRASRGIRWMAVAESQEAIGGVPRAQSVTNAPSKSSTAAPMDSSASTSFLSSTYAPGLTRKKWGTSYSPNYPTDREMRREADKLFARNDALAKEVREKRIVLCKEAFAATCMGQSQAVKAKSSEHAVGTPFVRHNGSRLELPLHERSSSTLPRCKRERYEPAKVVDASGRTTLRGVRSVSEIQMFQQDVNPYSRKSFEVRQAFKNKRAAQHRATAAATWNAFNQFAASDMTFSGWLDTAKKGARYSYPPR